MKSHQTLPGSFGLPLFGETLAFVSDPDFIKKRYRQFGSVSKTHFLVPTNHPQDGLRVRFQRR